jgi:hypothetical protein
MTARALLIVMMSGFVGGCSSEANEPGTPVPLQRLGGEGQPLTYSSGFTEPQRLIVRDQGAWADVWGQIWKGNSPIPELPAVDFGREMVVVAALGQRPTGGYSILVDSAHMTVEGLTIAVRQVSPDKSCPVTLALTQPVDVCRLQRTDNAVEFVDRAETRTCE